MNLIKQIKTNFLLKDLFKSTNNLIKYRHSLSHEWMRSMPYQEEGTGEIKVFKEGFDYEKRFLKHVEFPTENLEEKIFDGMAFKDIPILEVNCSKNNTKLVCFDNLYSKLLCYSSAGTEGFKKCKKGTTVAAHAAGYSMAKKLQNKGHKKVRIALKGLGSGRKAAIQGLNVAGLDIVSISDVTNFNPYPTRRAPRPLKR